MEKQEEYEEIGRIQRNRGNMEKQVENGEIGRI